MSDEKKIDESPIETANECKERGAKLYVSGDLEGALKEFQVGIDLARTATSTPEQVQLMAALHTNAIACLLKMVPPKIDAAGEHSAAAVMYAPTWSKTHLRRAEIALERRHWHGVEHSLQQAFIFAQTDAELQAHDALKDKMAALRRTLQIAAEHKESQKTADAPETKLSAEYKARDGAFRKWLADNGCKWDVKMDYTALSENYREMRATQHIHISKSQKRTALFTIPRKLLIVDSDAREKCPWNLDLYVALAATKQTILNEQTYTALYLVQEKVAGKDSFYAPYLDMMPSYADMVTNQTPEYLGAQLKGTMALMLAGARREEMERSWQQLNQLIPHATSSSGALTKDLYFWARNMITTRIFASKIKGEMRQMLVPIVDMLNHATGGDNNTVWGYHDADPRSEEPEGFMLRASRSIKRGDQVTDSYGKKCNSYLLVHYGFVLEDNPDNQATFTVGKHTVRIPISHTHETARDEFGKLRVYVKELLDDHERKTKSGETKSGESTMKSIVPLSLESVLKGDKESADHKALEKRYRLHPIGLVNEFEVLRALAHVAQRALTTYETRDELEDPTKAATPLERSFIILRNGEKRVYMHYLNLFLQVNELRKSTPERRKALFKKIKHSQEPIHCYLTDVLKDLLDA